MVGQQLALACRLRRLSIEPVLEDRLDRAVGTGADIQTAIAGRLQPRGAVLARQPQDAEASAVALFGMWPALQDQRGELGSARANRRRLTADPLDRPFGITPVRTRHVLGDCRMPTATGATQMHRDALAPCLRRGKLLRNNSIVCAVMRASSCSRISRCGTE